MKTFLQSAQDPHSGRLFNRVLPRIDRILVPTDFSEPSILAIESALCFLKKSAGAHLTLVHIIQPTQSIAMMDAGMSPLDDLGPLEELARTRMERLQNKYDKSIALSCRVVVGSPVWEISNMVSDGQFDLIVMSSHGRSGLKRMFLGSVAEGVLHNAKCSVLVIKPPKHQKGGSESKKCIFKKVLVGFDHRAGASAALDVAEKIIGRTGGNLTLVHALPPPNVDLPTDVLRSVEEEAEEIMATNERLRQAVSRAPHRAPRDVRTAIGAPWEVLSDTARELAADLVIVGPHEHFHRALDFIGSTAQRLVRLSPCSVLAVK
jgi:nucleotide-binding universal stress UspA family protein